MTTEMTGVVEYEEEMPVELVQRQGHWVIRAYNEGGQNHTSVDVAQLLTWLKAYRPDLLADAPR